MPGQPAIIIQGVRILLCAGKHADDAEGRQDGDEIYAKRKKVTAVAAQAPEARKAVNR